MFGSSKLVVGLDVGSYSVKAVALQPSGERLTLQGYAQARIGTQEPVEVIRKVLDQLGVKARRAVTSVSGRSVIVRQVETPRLPSDELKAHIAYEADMEFVATTMLKVAKEEVGIAMAERVKIFRDLLAKTPVDHLEVQGEPVVFFRVSENTWLEAILRYLVHPKEAGRVKSRLIRKLLPALNEASERVLFPKLNAR